MYICILYCDVCLIEVYVSLCSVNSVTCNSLSWSKHANFTIYAYNVYYLYKIL